MGQDETNGTPPNSDEGGKGGSGAGTDSSGGEKTTFTLDELNREADRRATAARKAAIAEHQAVLADVNKSAEAKVVEIQAKAEESERYATFCDVAVTSGIKNLKAAYIVARELGHIKSGKLDITEFKKAAPEFFNPTVGANPGAGTNKPASASDDMNAWIRARAAGQ
jgi:hypothetical protein